MLRSAHVAAFIPSVLQLPHYRIAYHKVGGGEHQNVRPCGNNVAVMLVSPRLSRRAFNLCASGSLSDVCVYFTPLSLSAAQHQRVVLGAALV
ncbi:hypothetical protein BC835DRAFT_1092826 [Cytidiella melzeri]|nr:hypothetical protein BC835DRAFT_1092826 [Cytidiella melzeri]